MCRDVGDCRSADDILAKKKAKHILQHKKQLWESRTNWNIIGK